MSTFIYGAFLASMAGLFWMGAWRAIRGYVAFRRGWAELERELEGEEW